MNAQVHHPPLMMSVIRSGPTLDLFLSNLACGSRKILGDQLGSGVSVAEQHRRGPVPTDQGDLRHVQSRLKEPAHGLVKSSHASRITRTQLPPLSPGRTNTPWSLDDGLTAHLRRPTRWATVHLLRRQLWRRAHIEEVGHDHRAHSVRKGP
jgi:hypothetical protein